MSTNTSESADENEADVSPIPTDITRFTRGPSSVAALVERATTVDSQFAEFNKRLARAEIDLGTRIEKKRSEVESLRGSLSPDQRRHSLEKASTSIRNEVVKATDTSRWEVLKQMARAEEEILAVESQYQSPAHILMREGLGSPERSRFQDQISNSGPFELQNYAAHAVATDNKVLGAAILTRLDRMNRRDRELAGINRQELASALVSDEYRNAQAAIQRVKNRLREAMAANRGFMTGKGMNVRDKIGLALNRDAEKGADDG